jgi:hypothetical protein
MQSAQHARERLNHGGLFVAHIGRNGEHVLLNNTTRNANVFGVGTVIEQQIFAEIFLVLGAVKAHLAGRGVQCHHAHAFFESTNT